MPQHDDRRLLRKCFGGRVDDFQSADAIRHAHRAEAAHARIRVSRKARALLVARGYDFDFAALELVIKTEHIIAGNSEDVSHAVSIKAVDEILPDRWSAARRHWKKLRFTLAGGATISHVNFRR